MSNHPITSRIPVRITMKFSRGWAGAKRRVGRRAGTHC